MMHKLSVGLGLVMVMQLAACGAPNPNGMLGRAVTAMSGAKLGHKLPQVAHAGKPVTVSIPAFGASLQMWEVDRDGDVTIWQGDDGSQIATRKGILIWTRGFGGDLMSAAAPDPAQIRDGAQYARTNHYVSGSDSRFQRDYTCTVSLAAPEDAIAPKALSEVCDGDGGRLRNQFLLGRAGTVAQSKQWVSNSVGYMEIAF